MDSNLQQRIEQAEYGGFTGREAVDEAYKRIFARYDNPRSESDMIMTFVNSQGFRKLFEMYFALHPEEAQQIVEEHNSRHTGLRRLLEPFAYFGKPVRSERYTAAKQRVEISSGRIS
jgi:hypothetical protein